MSVSRRQFLASVPAAGAAVALGSLLAVRRAPRTPDSELEARNARSGSTLQPGAPVVSFHLDRPYLDLTGLGTPYIPPAGMRSGAPLAALSDEELSRFYGFI